MKNTLDLHEMNQRLINNYTEFQEVNDEIRLWSYDSIIKEQEQRDLRTGVEYE